MKKEKFKNLFNQYVDDGFELIDIELKNRTIVGYNHKNMMYRFLDGEFQISGFGILIQVKYSVINSIAI